MPITFSINYEDGYYIATYTGRISDETILTSYKTFYEGDQWIPELNELSDLSGADLSDLKPDGLKHVADFAKAVFKKHNIHSIKTAIFAPTSLPYGLARMYEALAFDSPELTQVFRSMQEAEAWLKGAIIK